MSSRPEGCSTSRGVDSSCPIHFTRLPRSNVMSPFQSEKLVHRETQGSETGLPSHHPLVLRLPVISYGDPVNPHNERTPYGEIMFGDGVQTWINPRLSHS